LQAGALRVHAIDVGRNQLHERLRADPRVISREQTNAREIGPETLGELAEFCAADLSFISLLKVVPAAAPLLAPGAILVALIKPQFEAGREWVRRGGRVLDPEAHRLVLRRVLGGLAEIGFAFQGLILSPLRGPAGNWEYLACLRKTPDGRPAPPAPEDSIAAAMRGAFDAGTEE